MVIFSRHKRTAQSTREPKLRLGKYVPWQGGKEKVESVVAHAIDPSAVTPIERTLCEAVPVNPRPALHYLHDEEAGGSGNVWHQGGEYYLAAIGSPEYIIDRSDLTDTERERATLQSRQLARDSYAVMAVAELALARPVKNLSADIPGPFSFVGFVTVTDVAL